MPEPFASPPSSAPVSLIEAYELLDPPKPSLSRIIDLIRSKEISGRRDEQGFWVVDSLDQFESEVRSWIVASGFNEPAIWNVLPAGYVTIAAWVREHVVHQNGREKRLIDSQKPAQLSTYARDMLSAGDLPEALFCEGRIWAAKPADIKVWLFRRFGIAVR